MTYNPAYLEARSVLRTDVLASRAVDTWYQNTGSTAREVCILAWADGGAAAGTAQLRFIFAEDNAGAPDALSDGEDIVGCGGASVFVRGSLKATIGPGQWYQLTRTLTGTGDAGIDNWYEGNL